MLSERFHISEEYQAYAKEQERVFHSEDEYNAWVLEKLKEAELEAADPNTRWITWEESEREIDAWLEAFENNTNAPG